MTKAREILLSMGDKPGRMVATEVWISQATHARAWIAFAREITMHSRGGPG